MSVETTSSLKRCLTCLASNSSALHTSFKQNRGSPCSFLITRMLNSVFSKIWMLFIKLYNDYTGLPCEPVLDYWYIMFFTLVASRIHIPYDVRRLYFAQKPPNSQIISSEEDILRVCLNPQNLSQALLRRLAQCLRKHLILLCGFYARSFLVNIYSLYIYGGGRFFVFVGQK